MPGAGKSLASSVMKARGIPVFVSGDIIRAEARKRKLKFTRKNLGELMLDIRRKEGMGAVAKRLVSLVEKVRGEHAVYEGARSVEEVDELRRRDRKSTRLNSSHITISYAVFCLKKKRKKKENLYRYNAV